MIYGLYLSAQGAETQAARQAVVANNLANAGTTAFKRDLALLQAHAPFDVAQGLADPLSAPWNAATGGISHAGTVTDFRNGPVSPTGGNLDVALVGPGFLQVTDGQQEFLTRNGRLALDGANRLVLADSSHLVLNAEGLPISVPPTMQQLEITPQGTLYGIQPDGERTPVAQLRLVEPVAYPDLVKQGQSLYSTVGPLRPAGPMLQVKQGFIEDSGVQPVAELMTMIESTRAFEANMNMIRFQDDMLARLLQSIPRR